MVEIKKTISGKYHAKEVEAYVKNLRNEYEKNLKEQRQRIIDLRDENRTMKSSLEEFKKSEKHLSDALIDANQKSEEIINKANIEAHHIKREANVKLDLYNSKIDEYRKKIYVIEDSAIKILKDVIIEVSKVREEQIREYPRVKMDVNVERAIDNLH